MPHPFGNDPVKYLKNNLLTLESSLEDPGPEMVRRDGTVLVRLVDVSANWKTRFRNRHRKGLAALVPKSNQRWWSKPTAVRAVIPAKAGEADAFPAYICPWRTNHLCSMTLAGAAQVMFTGDMVGCTFGAGMANDKGGVRVGHANADHLFTGDGHSNADYAAQWKTQRDALKAVGAGNRLVDPADYRTTVSRTYQTEVRKKSRMVTDQMGTVAITVGLWINRRWEFYYQHQVVDGGAQWREGLELVKVG